MFVAEDLQCVFFFSFCGTALCALGPTFAVYDAAQQFIPESPTAVDIFKSWSKAHFFSLAFKSNRDQYGIIIGALTFCVVPLLSFMCILNCIHLQKLRCALVNISFMNTASS